MINTTVDEDFLDNFHLVYESKPKNRKLKFFCPLIDANAFNYDSLIMSLRDAAGHYCLSRRTWEEYNKKPMQLSHIVREKFRTLDKNKGELGELLLFSFLETDLKAPKILTKMELKTNPNMYFNGADGVHYVKLSNGNYQLIFGESKAHSNLCSGITAALDSVKSFKEDAIKTDASGSAKGITFEKGLLNACIAQEAYSDEEKMLLKSLIYPKASAQFSVDTAFGIFILYDLAIDNNERKKSNDDFRTWLYKDLEESISNMMPNILKKIDDKGLSGHSFYFYIVPFENMDKARNDVLTQVVE